MSRTAGTSEATPAVLVDRYQLLERIGTGGMGVVWRGFDLYLEEIVAIKFLHDDLAKDEILRGWFRREVKLARRVTHPNVARVYEFGRDGARYFLTMEFVEGESLQAVLNCRGCLPAEQVMPLALSLCRGLAAAHAVGVVHGDIKPANILLAPGRGSVLTDFGIARVLSEAYVREETSGGTPLYMAPEQLLGGALTLQSDVYAVGIVLFEALTGVLPWPSDDMLLFLEDKCSGYAPDLRKLAPDLPEPWFQLITDCLQVDPLLRPEHARALVDRLAAMTRPGIPGPASDPAAPLADEEARPRIELGPHQAADGIGALSPVQRVGGVGDAATQIRVPNRSLATIAGRDGVGVSKTTLLYGGPCGVDTNADPVASLGLVDTPDQRLSGLGHILHRVEEAVLYREPSQAELTELYGLAEIARSNYVDLGEAHLVTAGVLLTANEPIQAAHSAAKAVRRAPGLVAAIALVAEILCEISEFADAERHLDTALALDRGSVHAWLGRARLMAYQARWDDFFAIVEGRLAGLFFRTVHALHLLLWPGPSTRFHQLALLLDESRDQVPLSRLARDVMDFALERRDRHMIFERLVEACPPVHHSRHTRHTHHTRHLALLLCEMACILGEVERARKFLALADDLAMFEWHWLEHCPTIGPLRADMIFVQVREHVRARANSIADILTG